MSSEGLQGLTNIFQGIEGKKSLDAAARDEKRQASIILEESKAEAFRVEKSNIKAIKKQKLQFLKSGITLEDTPLLVLEEAQAESEKEVDAIRKRGGSRAAFGRKKAKQFSRGGRAAFTTGVLSGFAEFSKATPGSTK